MQSQFKASLEQPLSACTPAHATGNAQRQATARTWRSMGNLQWHKSATASWLFGLIALLATLFAPMQAQAQQIVSNGTFENGLTGWSTSTPNGAVNTIGGQGVGGTTAFQGFNNSASFGTANQVLATTVGAVYNVSVAYRSSSTGGSNRAQVQIGAASSGNLALTTSYQNYTTTFTATAASTTISLRFRTVSGSGVLYFDNVSVVSTSAPVLSVTPATNFTSTGGQGGPFTPSPASYSVTNTGSGTLNWSVTKPSWLTFSTTGGALAAGASATIAVSVNTADPAATTAGISTGNINFTSDGGSAQRTATLTVNDTTTPVLTVPANISVFTPSGSATATVNYTVSATDNVTSPVTPVRTAGLASGAAFPIGVTTVTHTATDAAGNTSTANFTVTVIDNVPPVIAGCPANQTVAAVNNSGATATWTAPTSTDNSGVSITPTGSHAPGATFALGVTVVVYSAIDPGGNVATPCTFTITVTDQTPPVLTVPANISVFTPSGSATATVNYTVTATDNVAASVTPLLTVGLASGAAFPIGVTTVTHTATDGAGNTSTASFTVTVVDNVPPVFAMCPANQTLAATNASGAVASWATPTVTDNSGLAVTPTGSHASGATFPLGATLVTYNATDGAGNTATPCTFTITVTDQTPPVLTVPANITVNTPSGSATATVNYTVSATDNVTASVTPVLTVGLASGAAFPIGVTTVTHTATDGAGNTSTAGFTVTVIDNVPPVFGTCPANQALAAVNASGAPATFSVTATDNSGLVVTPVGSHASGATFPLGATLVTYNATDGAGNAAIPCTFTITVTDQASPTISGLPANATLNTPSGSPTATHTWVAPTATDNVGVASFTLALTPAGGSQPATLTSYAFPIGVTTLTYTATDAAGLVTTSSFTVTVIDNVVPVFGTCPANQTIAAINASGAPATWTAPNATDNSGGAVSIVGSHTPGANFPIGTTTVSYAATDPYSNAAVPCTFTITITDQAPPVINGMPANATLNTPSGSATATHTWVAPTANDNVSVVSFTLALTPVGGAQPVTLTSYAFPIGVTTLTYIATDNAGLSTSQNFTVTVIDNVPPVFGSCPADQTLAATGASGAAATWTAPPAVDNSGGTVTIVGSHAPGAIFPIGATVVTYTATDPASNAAVPCTFTITVNDSGAPVISGMPANITLNTPSGSATAAHTWVAPTATDNVGVTGFTLALAPVGGAQPASLTTYAFPIGVTTLTYTATDAAGNTTTTAFTVTVIDNVPPVIAGCPANQTIAAVTAIGSPATWVTPTASDNSGGAVVLTGSHVSGAVFPLGVTTVTYTATDAASNAATPCTFTITVIDQAAPVIGTVSNIIVTATDLSGAVVNFPLPSVTDNVAASPVVSAAPAPGALFPIGVTTVIVTATDAAGNSATKSFTVTVLSPAQLNVTPAATGLVASGPQGQQGAPFAPSSQTYTLSNTGQVPLAYTITGAPGWVAPSPASGTIAAGASINVTVALTVAANTLAVGPYNGTLSFNNTTSNIGTTTRPVQLTVLPPAAMVVTPATAFVASGPQGQLGGAFAPATASYTVQNTGALPMTFAVSGAPAWMTLSAVGGTLAPGASQTVTASFNSAANALPVGAQSGTLNFTNTTSAIGNTVRSLTLNVLEPARLTVTPAEGLVAGGQQGGPFSPSSKTYTLTNSGAYPLDFTAADNQGWLDTAPASGTIPPGGSTSVTLSINSAANALASTTHSGVLRLSNTTNGLGDTMRSATLTVIPNGQVVLKVVTTEGDGTFGFSSPTVGLNMSLTSSGGSAQSSPITLNPGTYGVVVTPPDGFGLTGVTCSDSDSSGSVAGKSARIVLASAEVVTCTFTTANSRKRTVEVINRFMGRRNDMLLSNGPDTNRQIDRLIDASRDTDNGAPQSGFAASTIGTGANSSGLADGGNVGPSRLSQGAFGTLGSPATSSTFGGSSAGARLSAPNGTRLFEERLAGLGVGSQNEQSEPQAGLSPFSVTGSTEGTARFSFATSLHQMLRSQQEAEERKYAALNAEGTSSLGMSQQTARRRAQSSFDIWAEGHYVSFADDRNKANTDGHFGVLYMGADYIVNPSLLIGALVQFDSMHQSATANGFDIKGKGWMAGPYATLRLSKNVFLQTRAAFGRSNNEVSPFLTYTDSFTTKRWLATATLVGRWQQGNWTFQPSASVAFIEDVSTSYTDSLGVTIPSLKNSLGQFKAGPQFSYRHTLTDGTILEPRFGIEAIWNFAAADRVADFGGTLTGPEEVRGKVEVGLKAQFTNGIGIDLSGSYDGIGSKSFNAVGGKATVRIPLN